MKRAPRNVSAWTDLVGKRIQYMLAESEEVHEGEVNGVRRKNVKIGGNWIWRDDITRVKVLQG